MLAKELYDFLHIYRKDTGQIRVDLSSQLEMERKKNRGKLIDEKAFQTLLYKCCEAELEEIMSVYMKNNQDSSVFLGASKSAAQLEPTDPVRFNLTLSSLENITQSIAPASAALKPPLDKEPIVMSPAQTTAKLKHPKSAIPSISSMSNEPGSNLATRLKSSNIALKKKGQPSLNDAANDIDSNTKPKKVLGENDNKKNLNATQDATKNKLKSLFAKENSVDSYFTRKEILPTQVKPKKTADKSRQLPGDGDELSGLSCDSFISNSSESSEKANNFINSRSLSRNSSLNLPASHKKLKKRNPCKDKTRTKNLKMHQLYSTYNSNQAVNIVDSTIDKTEATSSKLAVDKKPLNKAISLKSNNKTITHINYTISKADTSSLSLNTSVASSGKNILIGKSVKCIR